MKMNLPCKINLGLRVLNLRSDGYHNIESVLFAVPFGDELCVTRSGHTEFIISGLTIDGEAGENLCLKAHRLMESRFGSLPVRIELKKKVPAGAGLGGGSADAAFTLMALNELYNLGVDNHTLQQLAASLGSDCPFFIDGSPALATGRGDCLKNIDLSLNGWWLLIVKPPFGVSTKEAYSLVEPSEAPFSVEDTVALPVACWKSLLVNDFERGLFRLFPAIGKLKSEMYSHGAVFAAMSGSGSAVFGLFNNKPPTGWITQGYFSTLMLL